MEARGGVAYRRTEGLLRGLLWRGLLWDVLWGVLRCVQWDLMWGLCPGLPC